MYAVPNKVLDEQANWTPDCNKTNYCVLYVGEDYNDFSKPKVFSEPFLFTSVPPHDRRGDSEASLDLRVTGVCGRILDARQ